MEKEITKLDRTEINKVIELFRLVWKHDEDSISAKTVWAFQDPIKSKVLVLKNSTNDMISVRGALNWPVKVGDLSINAFQFHGTCVHPDFRRQGLFSILNKAFVQQAITEGYDLIFNVSVTSSRLGYEKLGWKYLKGFRRLTKLNKPFNFIKSKTGAENLHYNIEDQSHNYETLVEFPKEFLNAREIIFKDLIHTEYTHEFLMWRLNNPVENYKIYHSEKCIIIYKIKYKGGLKELIIGDFFLLSNKYKIFKSAIKKLTDKLRPDITYTYIFNSHPYYSYYLRSLFVPNPLNYNLNFGTRLLNSIDTKVFNNKKWGMGFLDIDTF